MTEKHSFTLLTDFGTGEVFMSRLLHFANYILKGLDLTNIDEIKDDFFTVIFDGLAPAFTSLRDLRAEWGNDKIPLRKKQQHI